MQIVGTAEELYERDGKQAARVFLVGGFGASEFLADELRMSFMNNANVIITTLQNPGDAQSAIMRGKQAPGGQTTTTCITCSTNGGALAGQVQCTGTPLCFACIATAAAADKPVAACPIHHGMKVVAAAWYCIYVLFTCGTWLVQQHSSHAGNLCASSF